MIAGVLLTAVAVFGLVASALPAQAFSLGVSPATLRVVMQEGAAGDLAFQVTRDDTSRDFTFRVTPAADAAYVSMPEGDTFTLAAGEQAINVPFAVDTQGLAPGEYRVSFEIQQADVADSGATLTIRFGLQSTLELVVVAPQEYATQLHAQAIQIHGNYLQSPTYASRERMRLNYEIRNVSDLYVFDLSTEVELLTAEGESVERIDASGGQNLPPMGNSSQQLDIIAPKPGEYTLKTRVYSGATLLDEEAVAVTVEPAKGPAPSTLVVIILGAAAVVGTVIAVRAKRS